MSKVLVTYCTGTGCTESVAARIGRTLEDAGMQVDVRPMDSGPAPDAYDAVVAGSGIRAGSWNPKAKKWMSRNAESLKRRPLALFSVGMSLAEGPQNAGEMLGYTDKMLETTGVTPKDIGVFAGWFEPDKFSWIERKIMKMKGAPEGDFRDWGAIGSWASAVAPKLQA